MPSIKKAVYGIFRQLSSNSVAPSSSTNQNDEIDTTTSDEILIRNSNSVLVIAPGTVNSALNKSPSYQQEDDVETSPTRQIEAIVLGVSSTTARSNPHQYSISPREEGGHCSTNYKEEIDSPSRSARATVVSHRQQRNGIYTSEGTTTAAAAATNRQGSSSSPQKIIVPDKNNLDLQLTNNGIRKCKNNNHFNSENGCRLNGTGINMEQQSFIQLYLSGRYRKPQHPETYSGKTGVDLPLLQVVPLNPRIFASYTGPDGGLTQVPCVTRRPLANIANLDDELNLSYDADLDALSALTSTGIFPSPQAIRRTIPAASSSVVHNNNGPSTTGSSHQPHRTQSLNSNCDESQLPVAYETKLDWTRSHDQAYGLSTSLYECHPFTKVHAGTPVADVFAICARQNSCVLALADGVNWGEKSRLAARCAIRGAVEHLDDALYNSEKPVRNTLDIFHALLGAFHTGHQLILQETGALTTLCVVVAAPLNGDSQWVVCACNVGDSLAFVYSEKYGVREVTLGSHDIQQMRDMRDAGGALGPVDGVNPELHNMTCSMTTVDPGDIVFITSDGVSDNFDPVVGKFCVIRDEQGRTQGARKPEATTTTPAVENGQQALTTAKSPTLGGRKAETNGKKEEEDGGGSKLNTHLPAVEAYQRHELMLLRMEDLLRHGVTMGDQSTRTARHLCENLINFATQLTTAKRRILEEPELYQGENRLTQRDQRLKRRQVRQRISEMPGKLDHATVVAFSVGERWVSPESTPTREDSEQPHSLAGTPRTPQTVRAAIESSAEAEGLTIDEDLEQITIEQTDVYGYAFTEQNASDTPKLQRRALPPISMESNPSSPITPPPLPTEPLPPLSSSSDEEEDDLPRDPLAVKGPYEPQLEQLADMDGAGAGGSESDWNLANRVRMIDESSVSSLSACGSTPTPPPLGDDEESEERAENLFEMGMDEEELATPAQEYPPPWPHQEASSKSRGEVQKTEGSGHQEDGGRVGHVEMSKLPQAEEPSMQSTEEQLPVDRPIATLSEEPIHNDGEPSTPPASPENGLDGNNSANQKLPELLPLPLDDDWKAINVDVNLSSPEDTYHAYGSISISNVLECCNLIIKDMDLDENRKSKGSKQAMAKSADRLDESQTSGGQLDEDEVLDIFESHGVPLSARRWPPPSDRTVASKCASLPLGAAISTSDANRKLEPGSEPTSSRHRPASQRSLMNESYYMATGTNPPTEEATTPASSDMSASAADSFERGNAKMGSGRFGKLSKAIDRLERVVGRRKHRRGSPNRHTVATDGAQWAEMKLEKDALAPPTSSPTPNRLSAQAHHAKELTPTEAMSSSSPSHKQRFGTSHMHLAWSPVRAFRALTSPRRQSAAPSPQASTEKKSDALQVVSVTQRTVKSHSVDRERSNHRTQHPVELRVNVVDTTADVIVAKRKEEEEESGEAESVTYVVPHSASDTDIVVKISVNKQQAGDSGKESDV